MSLETMIELMQQQLAQQQKQLDLQQKQAAEERSLLLSIVKNFQTGAALIEETSSSSGQSSSSSATQLKMTSDFQDVSAQIGKFVYSPEEGSTFEVWYKRAKGVFASGKGKNVSEEDKAAIIRSKLSDNDFTTFANSILPKEPEELSLDEMTERLKKIFGRKESLFARRYKAWRVEKLDDEDFVSFAARINRAAEDFEYDSFQIDDFKMQLFIQGLKSIKDASVLKELLKKTDAHQAKRDASVDPESVGKLTLDDLAVIAERMVTLEKDRRELESHPVAKEEISAIMKNEKMWKCWFCGDDHLNRKCPYREKRCDDCGQKGHRKGYCASAERVRQKQNWKKNPHQERKNHQIVTKLEQRLHLASSSSR